MCKTEKDARLMFQDSQDFVKMELFLTKETQEMFRVLKSKTGSENWAEVFRRAMSAYNFLKTEVKEGEQLAIIDEKGTARLFKVP